MSQVLFQVRLGKGRKLLFRCFLRYNDQPSCSANAGRSQMARKKAPEPKPMPTSKDDMISALEKLGLQVRASKADL